MKYVVPYFFLILFSCGTESENTNQIEIAKENTNAPKDNPTFEKMLDGLAAPNVKDGNGFRQGHWCIYGKDVPASGYPDDGKIEEGSYEDDKKSGDWIYYSPEGAIDSMISYDSGISKRPSTGINYVDKDGLKNGYWMFYGRDIPARGFPADAKIEEGRFKDDIKDGRWIYFGKDGRVDSTVTYENNAVVNVWMPRNKVE
jgi:hypothetical protein